MSSKVRFYRRGFGINQDKVAEVMGVSRPTLKKKEEGELDFTRTEMIKIVEMFNTHDASLTIQDIFFV